MIFVTCIAPVNIAVVKYWGKSDEQLIIPLNDSISGTLSMDHMRAKITIAASPTFTKNRFWLNGKEEEFQNERRMKCIDTLKGIAQDKNPNLEVLKYKLHICSENNFPTGAGLASSAAGYACFVYTLAALYGCSSIDLSRIARLGSGSACRSVYGGFVRWEKGQGANAIDGGASSSIARQIVDQSFWPEMRVLILVINDKQKKISSTIGMRNSAIHSQLLTYRASNCAIKHCMDMETAILDKDFPTFAEIAMKDSNQFHAICLDTYPPCMYMNDASRSVIELVHQYNELEEKIKVAYTFDAGPNACLFMLKDEIPKFYAILKRVFPRDDIETGHVRGLPINENVQIPKSFQNSDILKAPPHPVNTIKYVIHTEIGAGPKQLHDDNESLLNDIGVPYKLAE